MPIFEYECPECGHAEEIVVFGHDDSFHFACRHCGALMTRLMSAPAIAKLKEETDK